METPRHNVLASTKTLTFIFTLTYLLLLPGVQHVRALSAWEVREQSIMASNMTSDLKFRARTLLNHRRFCRTSRLCLTGVAPDHCEYCSPCQCDDLCLHYGDCCPDLLFKHQEKDVAPLELKQSCHDNLYRGYNASQRQARMPNATSYFMTDTCPPATKQSLQQACTSSSLYLPVSVLVTSEEEGKAAEVIVFANKFCAQCHGFNASDFTAWKLMVQCPSVKPSSLDAGVVDLILKTAGDDSCYVLYHPPASLPPRQCFFDDQLISTCNVTGAWPARDEFYQRACDSYLDPMKSDGRQYRNAFCYLCNTDPSDQTVYDQHLFGTCWNFVGVAPMPFSALVDFSEAVYGIEDQAAGKQCLSSQIYDDETNECREVLCSRGRQYTGGNCSVVLGSALGLSYSLFFGMTSDTDLDLQGPYDLLSYLPELLEKRLLEMMDFTIRWMDFTVTFDTSTDSERCSKVSGSLSLVSTLLVSEPVDQDLLEHKLLSLRNTTFFFNESRASESLLLITLSSYADASAWLIPHKPGKKSSGGTCKTSISLSQDTETGGNTLVYTHVDDLLLMPQVALQQGEFDVIWTTHGLRVPWLDDDIPMERYNMDDDGSVRILLEDFLPRLTAYSKGSRPMDEVEVTLSVVCTSLSLAGLALTFVTYAAFRPLRTAPGLNNMNLCVALFVAQLIYLVGSGRTELPGACKALGILIHYSWLASFAAMSVCSFHMWRVFTSMTVAHDHHDQSQTKKRLLQYTVYIWGASAGVVVITLLTHLIVTGGQSIGYGGRYCYLSTTYGVAFAMGVPVALTVLANAVFFGLTVRTIRASPKVSKSRQDRQHVWVYLKLSSLTGVTWTLAFLVLFTEVTALEYAFTVVNALQGIFICVSFVLNRRVMTLYSACFRGDNSSLLPASSGGTMQSSAGSKSTETSFADATSKGKY